MTSLTGRTTFKWTTLYIGDTSNVLRAIPIDSLSALGVKYDEQEVTAWQDAVKGRLPTMPDAPIEFGGPWDTSVAASAPSLSGSHTVLNPLNGGTTPRTIDIRIGIRAAPEADSPQFGISQTATSGYVITYYDVDMKNGTYKARAVLVPGSALPAFGTTAET
jgi:hypothetical protein